MIDPRVSLQAYCKMLLHAAKYPHAAVNGLLLAPIPKDARKPAVQEDDAEEGESQSTAKKTTPLNITDAIPLFHQVSRGQDGGE